jgi:hypothetical protein
VLRRTKPGECAEIRRFTQISDDFRMFQAVAKDLSGAERNIPRKDGRFERQRAAPGRTVQAQIYCSEGSGRASLVVHLVNKTPKEHHDVREPSHLGNIGQHRRLVTPQNVAGCICR